MSCPTLIRRRSAPPRDRGTAPSAVTEPTPTRWLRALLDGDAALLQLVRFAMAGGLATAVQVLVFLLLAPSGVLLANLVAWAVSTALANEMHRRRTFHAEQRIGWLTAQWEGAGLSVLGLGITSGALATLAVTLPDAGAPVQALLVLAINAAVGLGRFLALRWAFVVRVPAA